MNDDDALPTVRDLADGLQVALDRFETGSVFLRNNGTEFDPREWMDAMDMTVNALLLQVSNLTTYIALHTLSDTGDEI